MGGSQWLIHGQSNVPFGIQSLKVLVIYLNKIRFFSEKSLKKYENYNQLFAAKQSNFTLE
jgi:hypothetical protein